MINLDRFAQGLPDMQDCEPVMECAACGFEIYKGDECFLVNGFPCCNDMDCAVKLGGIEKATA